MSPDYINSDDTTFEPALYAAALTVPANLQPGRPWIFKLKTRCGGGFPVVEKERHWRSAVCHRLHGSVTMRLAGPFLGRVIACYVRAFAPERIVLFGSYAKGTNHRGSDVDLLVIADVPHDTFQQQRRAHQLAADCFPPVDVVFATPDEVAGAQTAASPFLLSILGSGVTVYRRADPLPSGPTAPTNHSAQPELGLPPGTPRGTGSSPGFSCLKARL